MVGRGAAMGRPAATTLGHGGPTSLYLCVATLLVFVSSTSESLVIKTVLYIREE